MNEFSKNQDLKWFRWNKMGHMAKDWLKINADFHDD